MEKMIVPGNVRAYGDNLKATAVKLSRMPGVKVTSGGTILISINRMFKNWYTVKS